MFVQITPREIVMQSSFGHRGWGVGCLSCSQILKTGIQNVLGQCVKTQLHVGRDFVLYTALAPAPRTMLAVTSCSINIY